MSNLPMSSIFIKYLLFSFNLIFVVTGVIILSIGITIKAYYNDYELILDDKYFSIPNLLIAIGAIIFAIAFFGCCGAIKENYCMIVTFAILMILIFVLEFAAGISGYVLKHQTEEYLTTKLNNSLQNYKVNTSVPGTVLWDHMQNDFKCCGVHNYTDWYPVLQNLPSSCCGQQYGQVNITYCNSNTTTLFKKGCVEGFGTFVEDNAIKIGSTGLVLACIQFLGIVFSCHLSRQIKKNYETV